jgi:hypothetical protein
MPNPTRPNPITINIPGVEPGPSIPAASAPNKFVANATIAPPVRIPNNPFTIMFASS